MVYCSVDDCGLSTSTITSADGVLLQQFSVLVVGLAICLEVGVVFYVDLTHPNSSSEVDSRLQAVSSVLCRDSRKVCPILTSFFMQLYPAYNNSVIFAIAF